tara:strand:- start:194 stop:541 length:348 start_codon:yes stop_codon:yes gene_type:complete
MRKDFILILLTLAGLAYVFIFMMKNTRFESNLISCVNGQVSFQITYKKLKRDMFVNFEKPDEEITTFKITNSDGENFHFEHQLSKFKINLDEQTAIETRSGEKLIYKCALESFKM